MDSAAVTYIGVEEVHGLFKVLTGTNVGKSFLPCWAANFPVFWLERADLGSGAIFFCLYLWIFKTWASLLHRSGCI